MDTLGLMASEGENDNSPKLLRRLENINEVLALNVGNIYKVDTSLKLESERLKEICTSKGLKFTIERLGLFEEGIIVDYENNFVVASPNALQKDIRNAIKYIENLTTF